MAAATGDVAAAVKPDDFVVDLGFDDIDDFDVQDFDFEDFDLAADEFCDAYSAFVANADANNKIVGGGCGGGKTAGGWLAGLCGGDGGEGSSSREGSPDSGVTDGPLAGEEAMLAYVAELERFMMEDDGDVEEEEEVFCRDGDRVQELISVDGFFADLQLATDSNGGVVTATAGALRNENGGEESDDGDVLAAREDEQASRKRARPKIKGSTTMLPWRGELGVTRSHLARIQVPAPPVLHVALMAHRSSLDLVELSDALANALPMMMIITWPVWNKGLFRIPLEHQAKSGSIPYQQIKIPWEADTRLDSIHMSFSFGLSYTQARCSGGTMTTLHPWALKA